MDQVKFCAQIRESTGTGAARAIRRIGGIPAVLYSTCSTSCIDKQHCDGKQAENAVSCCHDSTHGHQVVSGGTVVCSVPITLNFKEFNKIHLKGDVQSKMVLLDFADATVFGKKSRNIAAVIRDMQYHPVTDRVLHIDLQEIDVSSVVHTAVGVHVLNHDKCVGIKQKGGTMNLIKRTIDVTCKPDDAVPFIEIDIENVDIGHSVHIRDVQFPVGITPLDREDAVVLSISGHTTESEPVDESATVAGTTQTANNNDGTKSTVPQQ